MTLLQRRKRCNVKNAQTLFLMAIYFRFQWLLVTTRLTVTSEINSEVHLLRINNVERFLSNLQDFFSLVGFPALIMAWMYCTSQSASLCDGCTLIKLCRVLTCKRAEAGSGMAKVRRLEERVHSDEKDSGKHIVRHVRASTNQQVSVRH